MPEYRRLDAGDPAPWFKQRTTNNPTFHFDTVGGRYLVLSFHGTAADDAGMAMANLADRNADIFDDRRMSWFGVSIDPADETQKRISDHVPGIRQFWDFDASVSRLYGAVPTDGSGEVSLRRQWVVIDPQMRILAIFPATDPASGERLAGFLRSLPDPDEHGGFQAQAPVIMLPRVFEPEFCDRLIGLYEQHGGQESGFVRDVGGKTTAVLDFAHKRRSDYSIEDAGLKQELQRLIVKRIVPEIAKVHQFHVTRMERYIVVCYDSATGGHFRAHRDNTTKGTAHRRFALSINLNDDFEGGEVRFPEYGSRSYKPPRGGAVIFSCSLLHEVSPVSAGRRYAFLPFLYDDAAAAIREKNNEFVDATIGAYRKA